MPMSKEDFKNLSYYKASENSQMPCVYKPPMGLPFYWMHCLDEELHRAIKTYFAHKAEHAAPPTAAQIALIADYLDHHIYAPCWLIDEYKIFDNEILVAREQVKNIRTVADIDEHVRLCEKASIDPF